MANDKGITIKMRTWIVLLVLALLAGFATYKIVRYSKDVAALERVLVQKEQNIKTFQIVVDGLNERVTEERTLRIGSQRALKQSLQYAERLKKLNIRHVSAIGSLELKIAAMEDSLEVRNSIVFYDTVFTEIEVVEVDDQPMIEIPASFGFQDEWVTSWGVITEDGMGESGFEVHDLPINIVLGSRGFFKKSYVSSVSTPNPYIIVDKQNFVVTDNTKKMKPILIVGGISFTAGIVTTLLLVK